MVGPGSMTFVDLARKAQIYRSTEFCVASLLHYAGSFQKKEMACVENSCRSRFLVPKKGVGVSIY